MEYKVIGGSFSPESLERAINNLAAEGWRVVSAFQAVPQRTPWLFRKLDAVAVLTGSLLPAP